MAVAMSDLAGLAASFLFTQSQFSSVTALEVELTDYTSLGIDPAYPVKGGLMREEAIMLLRKFYIQENEKGSAIFQILIWRILTKWKLLIRGRRRIVNCGQTFILLQDPAMDDPKCESVVLSQG